MCCDGIRIYVYGNVKNLKHGAWLRYGKDRLIVYELETGKGDRKCRETPPPQVTEE